ncbi:MAG: diguanylate cyclase [Bacillaceae bacterium]
MEKSQQSGAEVELLKNDETNFEPIRLRLLQDLRIHPQQCKAELKAFLKVADEKRDVTMKAWCFALLGWYYHDRAQFDLSLEYQMRAYYLFESKDDKKGLLFVYNGLMANYNGIGIYESAINYGLKGIALAEELNDERYLSIIYTNMTDAYIGLEMYMDAKKIYDQCSKLQYTQSSLELMIISYQLRAEIELHLGNTKKAVELATYAICIAKDYEIMNCETLRIRGEAYWKLGQPTLAEINFKRGIQIAKRVNALEVHCKILYKYGLLLQERKKEGAEKVLYEASQLAEKSKLRIEIVKINEALSDMYKQKGNFEKALYHLEIASRYSKEIFTKQNSIWINKLKHNRLKREAKEYKSMYDQVAIISRIGQKITANLKMKDILMMVYEEAKNIIPMDVFGIAIYKEDVGAINYELLIEDGKRISGGNISINCNKRIGAYCVREKKDVFINDNALEYTRYISGLNEINKDKCICIQALICCPLIVENKVKGFITVQSYEKDMYKVEDLNTLKILSSYIAIALENAELFNQVEYHANHDGLTGVWNRKQIVNRGEREFEKWKQYGTPLCVALFDLDLFKNINDTYGHLVGDELLKLFVQTVRATIKNEKFFGRYGGEEFLLVLPDTTIEVAYQQLEQIRCEFERMYLQIGDKQLSTTVSSGLYAFNNHAITFREGIKKADEALYRAKASGRNTVVKAL